MANVLAALRYLIMKLDEGRGIGAATWETPEEAAREMEEQERQCQRE